MHDENPDNQPHLKNQHMNKCILGGQRHSTFVVLIDKNVDSNCLALSWWDSYHHISITLINLLGSQTYQFLLFCLIIVLAPHESPLTICLALSWWDSNHHVTVTLFVFSFSYPSYLYCTSALSTWTETKKGT